MLEQHFHGLKFDYVEEHDLLLELWSGDGWEPFILLTQNGSLLRIGNSYFRC